MSLTETYGRVQVGKNMSDRFPIRNGLKQGDALSPLLFNFALEYAIRRVQVNQDGLKLNVAHQLLAYADDVNILGGSIHTLKENAGALVAATREIGLEVSADKTKYMVMSRDQNAGRNHSVRRVPSSFSVVRFTCIIMCSLVGTRVYSIHSRLSEDEPSGLKHAEDIKIKNKNINLEKCWFILYNCITILTYLLHGAESFLRS